HGAARFGLECIGYFLKRVGHTGAAVDVERCPFKRFSGHLPGFAVRLALGRRRATRQSAGEQCNEAERNRQRRLALRMTMRIVPCKIHGETPRSLSLCFRQAASKLSSL